MRDSDQRFPELRDSDQRFPEFRLQSVESTLPKVQPPLSDLAARLAIMLCDDPTDPDVVGIESYLEVARRH